MANKMSILEQMRLLALRSAAFTSEQIANLAAAAADAIEELQEMVSEVSTNTVPTYVVEEADRVAAEVLSHQNEHTFTFLAIADMHNMETGNVVQKCQKALTHAGQAMALLREKLHIDFAVNFGDYTWGEKDKTTVAMGRSETLNSIKMTHEAFRDIPHFYLKGNHDDLAWNLDGYFSASDTFAMIGKKNIGATMPDVEKERGYCYRDFDDLKLRVIVMNTVDSKGVAYPVKLMENGEVSSERTTIARISAEQLQWFADEALDMSGKEGWSIIVLGHHYFKLGYSTLEDSEGTTWAQGCNHVVSLMDYYTAGSSGTLTMSITGEKITYNFAGKNAAPIIATFNGHLHNFKTGVQGSSEIPWITVPNAFPGRDNERGAQGEYVYGEETTYPKTEDTAEDTAFCVITVDTAENKIYATHYGAGYDRVIGFNGTNITTFTITNNLSNATNSNAMREIAEGSNYTATIKANSGYELSSINITMGGVNITSKVVPSVPDNPCSFIIENVSGNIVITAVAVATSGGDGGTGDAASYRNLIPESVDTDGTIYNVTGYKANTYLGSSNGIPAASNGNYTTGFMPLPEINTSVNTLGRAIVYFANMDAPGTGNIRVCLYPEDKTGNFQMATATQLVTESEHTANYQVVKYTDDDGYVTALDISSLMYYAANISTGSFVPKWFRISWPAPITAASIITVNQPIEDSGSDDGGTGDTGTTVNYENLVPKAVTPPTVEGGEMSTEIYNGGLGYKNNARISGLTSQPTQAGYVTTGIIQWRDSAGAFEALKPIYIKGATLDPSLSYVRCLLITNIDGNGVKSQQLVYGTADYAWTKYFSIDTLGENYYKLTPVESGLSSWYNIRYIMMSLYGSGENLIITVDEPIE